MTTTGTTTGTTTAVPAPARTAAAAVLPLLAVGLLGAALGYPPPGAGAAAAGTAGLVLLGAVPAGLHRRWGLRAPAAVVAAALVGAVVAELVVPGPVVAGLDGQQLTLGVAVLARFVGSWPLVLAVALLVGLVEHRTRTARPRWATALRTAGAGALVVTGLVLLHGAGRGWATAPPIAVSWGTPVLLVLAFVAALLLVRPRLVAPAALLGTALTVAAVATWVQPVGDPAVGLLNLGPLQLVLGLLLAAGELAARAVARRLARRRTG
jgi:hypothetical protein